MIRVFVLGLMLFFHNPLLSQEIILDQTASLEQAYIDSVKSENLLPMNDLNTESGYVLYQSEISTESQSTELELENVRDYAAVYVDGKLTGTLTDSHKKISLETTPGKHQLQLYVENIGRITYGPEILDNSKGLFGSVTLNGEEIRNWTITPINVRNCPVKNLTFSPDTNSQSPCFYKGTFNVSSVRNTNLDISGWGMGEVWINNKYLGAYWEQEKQQSIKIQASDLVQGNNEIVVFELKNNQKKTMKLSETPVFK